MADSDGQRPYSRVDSLTWSVDELTPGKWTQLQGFPQEHKVHREGKQFTGLERCQCHKARVQRNYIGCAFLVWVRLKALIVQTGRTVYQLKQGIIGGLPHPATQKPNSQNGPCISRA